MVFYSGSLLVDLLALLTAVIAVGYSYLRWKHQYWKKRDVPYLEPSIPWGNLVNILNRSMSPGENMTNLYNQVKAKGWKYAGIYSMASPNLLVRDLDIIKQIMTKDFHNFMSRGVYTNEKDDPLTGHLFAISGKKWRNLRMKLTPTFTSGKMKAMFQTLVDCGLVLEKYIADHIDNNEGTNIKEILAKFSTDIIGSCAFGLECNSFKDPNSPFRAYGRKIFERSTLDLVKIVIINISENLARSLKITFNKKEVTEFFMKMVEDTVNYRRENNVTRNDFLQLLIEIMGNNSNMQEYTTGDGKTLTMEEAAAQCFVFFLAGFETSSTTMSFALYELARHQDIQDKVREEMKAVLEKYDNTITYESITDLKYLKQVIDETLRMYSPVPFVARVSAADYKVPQEDIIIRKGVKVIIPIQGIHLDEMYYKNPKEFDPDRFGEENKAGRHPYAHIPFGEGPRICIGERFGVMQSKVGLISVLKNFRVTLNKKTRVPLKFSVKSFIPTTEDGIWLNLEKI